MRQRTWPDLNAARLRRRSSMERAPPSTTQLYAPSVPLSCPGLHLLPPPDSTRNDSSRSQSKLVRQNTITCSILKASMARTRRWGLRRLTASLAASLDPPPPWPMPPSRECIPSVGAGGRRAPTSSDPGSARRSTWCTASGTASFPLRSTHVGLAHSVPASSRTSGECRVAEKRSTCSLLRPVPAFGSRPNSLRIASRLPVSSSRSASSSTRKRTRRRLSLPPSTRSVTRPTVPVTTSAPPWRARVASRGSVPPTASAAPTAGDRRCLA
mmetsp:Transcript_4035/g.14117  ORF Transcript_4035/g.14117 Transcript_4035/m.14117 type:complete len:269 (-) Transcript_4035:1303-2109(-)